MRRPVRPLTTIVSDSVQRLRIGKPHDRNGDDTVLSVAAGLLTT